MNKEESAAKWLEVGELVETFGGNELEPSKALSGKEMTLHFEGGGKLKLKFGDETLSIHAEDGAQGQFEAALLGQGGDAVPYLANSLRAGIFFVDFLPKDTPPRSVSLVIDLNKKIGTGIFAQLPTREMTRQSIYELAIGGRELTHVAARFVSCAIDAPFTSGTAKHAPTEDLVGRRVKYVYGPREAYEHIYLNSGLYTWQCLKGSELGLADTDRCHYLKIEENLYLFVWREKIIPTIGIVMIDFNLMKTSGKIFGYQNSEFAAVSNANVGAVARILNQTTHD